MCDHCVPVELPPELWEFLNVLMVDVCAGIERIDINDPGRVKAREWISQRLQEFHNAAGTAEDYLFAYVERVERRVALGERRGRERIPIPNMIHTVGSNDN